MEKTRENLRAGQAQWVAGYYDSAYFHFRQAQQWARQSGDDRLLVTAMHLSGKYLTRMGRLDEGEATLDSVLAMAGAVDPLFREIILARCERAFLEAYRGNFEGCVRLHEAIARDAQALPPSEDSTLAKVYHRLGNAYAFNEQYDAGLEYCSKALEIRRRILPPDADVIAFSENSVATLLMEMNRYDEAVEHYRQALSILEKNLRPGHTLLIQVKTNIAVLYQDLGLYREALRLLRENLPYLDELSPEAQGAGLFNLATSLMVVGDYDAALRYFGEAEDRLDQYPGLMPDIRGKIAGERSNVYRAMGRYEEALALSSEAIAESRKFYGADNTQLILFFTQRGSLFNDMGRYAEAIEAFREAIRVSDLHPDNSRLWRGMALEYMAESQLQLDRPRAALVSLDRAAAIYRAMSNQWQLTDVFTTKARAWRAIGDWEATRKAHREAWTHMAPGIPFQWDPDPRILDKWPFISLGPMLEEQGHSLLERYEQTGEPDRLQDALNCFRLALAVADSARRYYESPDSRQLGVAYDLSLVETALNTAFRLYDRDADPEIVKTAFQIAEQSKSGNLRAQLRGREALQFAGIPDSLLSQESYYRQRLAAIREARFEEENDSLAEKELEQQGFRLEREYQSLLRRLERDYPRYYHLRYATGLPVDELAAALQPDQALYSYFWGDSTAFVFRLFRGEWEVFRIPRRPAFEAALERWISFVSEPPGESETDPVGKTGYELAELLLPGTGPEMNACVLIPHGRLGMLPFESLLREPMQGENYRTWPFLARTLSTVYAPSAALWITGQDRKNGGQPGYLGFAPDFSGEQPIAVRADLGPLSHNREEVERGARIFDGNALLGISASEEKVKQLPARPTILHFATHAIADGADPMRSRLYLSGGKNSEEDGLLHAYEIYGMELNSPLTILSACQTGKGPVVRGEGIMSLARAFQYAGSRQVLNTLWSSDDYAGARVVQYFLEAVAAGAEASHGLQAARNTYLEEADPYRAHPYFWSGFVLVGNAPPEQAGLGWNSSLLWLSPLILLALGGLVFLFRRSLPGRV